MSGTPRAERLWLIVIDDCLVAFCHHRRLAEENVRRPLAHQVTACVQVRGDERLCHVDTLLPRGQLPRALFVIEPAPAEIPPIAARAPSRRRRPPSYPRTSLTSQACGASAQARGPTQVTEVTGV